MSAEPLKLTGAGAGEDELEDERGAEEPKPKKRRGGEEPAGARQRRRKDGDLRGRLEAVFERLAEWREGRGDDELARIIREDSKAMIGGIVALMRPLEALRPPLVLALSIVEPALAFGRVVRILGGRWQERRASRPASWSWSDLSDAELEGILNDAVIEPAVRADALAEQSRRNGG